MSMDFMFFAGASDGASHCLNVSIIDDVNALEGDKTFTVTLTTSDHIPILQTGTIITILNNGIDNSTLESVPPPTVTSDSNPNNILITVVSTVAVLAIATAIAVTIAVCIRHHHYHANSR